MKCDMMAVRERIEKIARSEMKLSKAAASELGFHLTDWSMDLDRYTQFCADPHERSDREVRFFLCGFIVHVAFHLSAAYNLSFGLESDLWETCEELDQLTSKLQALEKCLLRNVSSRKSAQKLSVVRKKRPTQRAPRKKA